MADSGCYRVCATSNDFLVVDRHNFLSHASDEKGLCTTATLTPSNPQSTVHSAFPPVLVVVIRMAIQLWTHCLVEQRSNTAVAEWTTRTRLDHAWLQWNDNWSATRTCWKGLTCFIVPCNWWSRTSLCHVTGDPVHHCLLTRCNAQEVDSSISVFGTQVLADGSRHKVSRT